MDTYSDGCLIHATSALGKVDVHDDCHGERGQVHEQGRTNEHGSPHARLGCLDPLLAVLGPVVGQIDEQNQANEQEETGSNHGKVVAPDDEERVGDEEGEDDHADPSKNLGAPEAVLDLGAAILGGADADEHEGHEDVEEAEGEVDALDGDEAVALLAVALDVDVVQGELGQLLHGPVGEHDPRDDRVDEEDERVGDAGCDAVAALSSAGAHDGAAGGRATAGGGDAPYLGGLARADVHEQVQCVAYCAHGGHGEERERQCGAHGCDVVGWCCGETPGRDARR